jgi:hypothetical protein
MGSATHLPHPHHLPVADTPRRSPSTRAHRWCTRGGGGVRAVRAACVLVLAVSGSAAGRGGWLSYWLLSRCSLLAVPRSLFTVQLCSRFARLLMSLRASLVALCSRVAGGASRGEGLCGTHYALAIAMTSAGAALSLSLARSLSLSLSLSDDDESQGPTDEHQPRRLLALLQRGLEWLHAVGRNLQPDDVLPGGRLSLHDSEVPPVFVLRRRAL